MGAPVTQGKRTQIRNQYRLRFTSQIEVLSVCLRVVMLVCVSVSMGVVTYT